MLPFSLFGSAHLLTLCVIGILLASSIKLYKLAPASWRPLLVNLLAYCCLISYPLSLALATLSSTGMSLENQIPFHLCDITAVICGLALITRKPLLCELAYFWGLAATIQGLITPNLVDTFPHLMFISFFWNHGFIVITALFLPLALEWKPRPSAMWKVFGCTQIYAAAALLLNHSLKTNFGFLAQKPQTASLLDYLPTWPWYILVLELLCLVLFALLQLPFSQKSVK